DLARIDFGLKCTWQLMDVTSVELGNELRTTFRMESAAMANYKWFERSDIKGHRAGVEDCLVKDNKLRPSTNKNESAVAFWERVEKAGLLLKALELYDEFAEENAEWIHRPRETKKKFAERIEREGRQTEVERMRQELLEDGYPLREIQE